jgi:C-methyltransferase C-terminal domain
VDVERVPLHHGQIRVFVQRKGEGTVRPSVAKLVEKERSLGMHEFSTYQAFADKTRTIKLELHAKLRDLRAQGKRLAGYGAPAKGNTLLSFLEIGPEILNYIADRSVLKQGRYTPGSHIPVVPPQRLIADQPDYVLLLAWNFVDEIIEQQAEYQRRGGKFIIPVPEVRLI